MSDPRTDLPRIAHRLVREATIYPQDNGALIVVIPYAVYVQLEDTLIALDDEQRVTRAARAKTPAPARPATRTPPGVS